MLTLNATGSHVGVAGLCPCCSTFHAAPCLWPESSRGRLKALRPTWETEDAPGS